MKRIQTTISATLALVIAVGCSGTNDDASVAATNTELARLEFSDGNVVRFEELNGGVLVSEMRFGLNQRHLVPKEGLTALEAFESMAPGREVPAALLRMHERMYGGTPAGDTPAGDARRTEGANPTGDELATDADLEHNGEFQGSYPAATFLAVMCDFPTGGGSYKHTDRTDAHSDISMNVHSTYFAVGADVGTITAKPCSGKNEGGYFNGKCGSTVTVNAGYHNSGFYDAGKKYVCSGIVGGGELCFPNLKRFELRYGKISTNVNFHDCAQISAVLTD